jgi:hypothetical protein
LRFFPFDSLECDIIYLADRTAVQATVLEVNIGATIYKLCGGEDEPKRTLLNQKNLRIEYADGSEENFDNHLSKDWVKREQQSEQKVGRKGIWFIGFIVGALLGILGILIAYAIYTDEPIARKKAISGSIIGFLVILILAFYIISKL